MERKKNDILRKTSRKGNSEKEKERAYRGAPVINEL